MDGYHTRATSGTVGGGASNGGGNIVQFEVKEHTGADCPHLFNQRGSMRDKCLEADFEPPHLVAQGFGG